MLVGRRNETKRNESSSGIATRVDGPWMPFKKPALAANLPRPHGPNQALFIPAFNVRHWTSRKSRPYASLIAYEVFGTGSTCILVDLHDACGSLRLATSLFDSLDCPVASPLTDSLDGRLEIIEWLK